MTWKIPLFKMYWDEDDVTSVSDAIRSGMNWAVGENVSKFEEEIADYIGTKYCLTFNSGTSATHAALIAHGIGKDDEVIVPSFTFISTANSPQFVGAKPIFADIEEKTFGLDPEDVVEKISPKTKAIMPVHYGGCPCLIRELREIADDNNLILIEDAAEAFGAAIGDKKVGTFGDSAMLSFCQNKVLTTGEGGAIVTDSRDLYEKMKLIRSHGRLETADYFSTNAVMDYVTLGYNFRMSNITAALGLSQLRKAEKIISMRRSDAEYYLNRLSQISGIEIPDLPDDYYHVYQLFSVIAKERDSLIKFLEDKGIMSKIYFTPVHKTHFYQSKLKYKCELPVTDRISENIISLPFYPGISRDDIDRVISSIKEFYGDD
ncbi:DegT/DnrJ/EryC1/StrS family aminotransferase [Methanoplanus endosymbiosus]|uniref:DegT/DnrJ/EryC1/StrS family aminotransferase n=1 Tax=Methanoplanus endosymbiosus TaxID=33865 RepID=A0A9E7PL92_9EURY|nr:DegT/DnrJ/EryC1/StrS family aminotransferase [Methanoplanus endosymbiosus]UUX92255.1 DegT/DnrJ/EryC1/StrS family aminotransferase [Methanoplanus endosymbiosus]